MRYLPDCLLAHPGTVERDVVRETLRPAPHSRRVDTPIQAANRGQITEPRRQVHKRTSQRDRHGIQVAANAVQA